MQVMHDTESDNFALLGGGRTRGAQMSSHGFAFTLLSNTLYRDKLRAVVRETMCNAIDAHIEYGTPDRPIEVTISDHEMVIRDFGAGFPDERAVEIYLNYFGSEKQQDKRVTGGFGLGAKSPFAISDHFTATNFHAGTRYSYALHRGDKTSDGRPAITNMGSGPTDDHGLRVSIPLEADQAIRAAALVLEIARNGGMKVLFTDSRTSNWRSKDEQKLLDVVDYAPFREHGFGLIAGFEKVQLLNANVLYPVDTHDELEFLSSITGMVPRGYGMVFIAKPGAVSIAPSRENLSYDEETLAYLNKIMARAIRGVDTHTRRVSRAEGVAQALRFAEKGERYADNWSPGFAMSIAPGPAWVGAARARFGAFRLLESLMKARTPFRRLAISEYHRSGYRMDRIEKRRITRPILRALAGTRHLTSIYSRMHTEGGLRRLSKDDRTPCRSFDMQELHIAPTQQSVATVRKASMYLIDAKIRPEEIEAIRDRCFKWGIVVIVHERKMKPKVEKVVVEKTARFPVLSGCGTYISTRLGQGFGFNTYTEKPDGMFITRPAKSERYDGYYVPDSRLPSTLMALGFEKVAAITRPGEVREAEALGVRRVEEVILERIEARLADPKPYDLLYLAVHDGPDVSYGTLLGYAYQVALGSRLLTDLVYELKGENEDPERDAAWSFWKHAIQFSKWSSYRGGSYSDAERERIRTAINTMREKIDEGAKTVKFRRHYDHLFWFKESGVHHGRFGNDGAQLLRFNIERLEKGSTK